jgi:hypothetical protein
MRRFTVTTPHGDTAEGVQFTSGLLVLDWDRLEARLQAWVTLDALLTECLGCEITWLDQPKETDHA